MNTLSIIFSEKSPFSLPSLPFQVQELEPYITSSTFNFHYKKHHQTYIDNLNKLIAGTEFETHTLEEIILKTANQKDYTAIFNNAAQTFNHTFFWHSLTTKSKSHISDHLKTKIEEQFSSLEEFKTEFRNAATSLFGSGWVWLCYNTENSKFDIIKTQNAEIPFTNASIKPLCVLDVWEHAYYLDFQNRRIEYINAFLENLINWNFIETNLKNLI